MDENGNYPQSSSSLPKAFLEFEENGAAMKPSTVFTTAIVMWWKSLNEVSLYYLDDNKDYLVDR